jgi:hypothetical protein
MISQGLIGIDISQRFESSSTDVSKVLAKLSQILPKKIDSKLQSITEETKKTNSAIKAIMSKSFRENAKSFAF